jgi:hypothetical protein
VAVPRLAVIGRSTSVTVRFSMATRTFSAASKAPSASVSGSRIRNSSPP